VPGVLRDFIDEHREELLIRASLRVAGRNAPVATEAELTEGLPVFLDQLCESLRKASLHERVDHHEIQKSAGDHGDALFLQGATVAQVVHDYGDLCQVITGLAFENKAAIEVEEFQTLNLCLDDAIAGAVGAFADRRERAILDEGTERLGMLAHEMRNLVSAALISFANIKRGIVAPGGATSAIHERSLTRLNTLIDRSLASVRLDTGLLSLERVAVWEIIEEVEISAAMFAHTGKLLLSVPSVDRSLVVLADRQILAAAVANLVQNAFKFTRSGSTVCLRAFAASERVLIEVEDECGGLPSGKPESLLRPFVQRSSDRSGVGLGLTICLQAMNAFSGRLQVRDLPGQGCVFTLDLPKEPLPPQTTADASRSKVNGGPIGSKGNQLAPSIGRLLSHFLPGLAIGSITHDALPPSLSAAARPRR
jgi:signal transduction histidine kinase